MSERILPIAPWQREGAPAVRGPSPGTLRAERPAGSLYIHVPFCFHKCHYCDFYSLVDGQDRMGAFVNRLVEELRAIAPWSGGRPLDTVFIGGGTPTLLPVPLWERLLATLRGVFDLSRMGGRGCGEFTVECNPETATPELMALLAGGGVTRLSLGAQSFDPGHLKTLERWHDPLNVARAVALARAAGISRLSVDLIYAIPGQTVGEALADIDRALELGVEHVSAYSLTYEPGTAMTARLSRGEFTPADEETDAAMFSAVRARLRGAGYRAYEVSNFALPGAECRHNLAYWRQRPWMAAGPSASAHLAGHRWKNAPRLGTYLETSFDGQPPVVEHETPDPRRALAERIMTGLRLAEGLDAASILAEAGRISGDTARAVRAHAEGLRASGLLRGSRAARPERWALTEEAVLRADGIASAFMAVVDP